MKSLIYDDEQMQIFEEDQQQDWRQDGGSLRHPTNITFRLFDPGTNSRPPTFLDYRLRDVEYSSKLHDILQVLDGADQRARERAIKARQQTQQEKDQAQQSRHKFDKCTCKHEMAHYLEHEWLGCTCEHEKDCPYYRRPESETKEENCQQPK